MDTLTHRQAQQHYDLRQTPGWFGNAAYDLILRQERLEQCGSVLEFGCGDGKLAKRLLMEALPTTATYLGLDVSDAQVKLARANLGAYAGRAEVWQTDGTVRFPVEDGSVDCVVSTYVLDLLAAADVRHALNEARRVVPKGGTLCLAGLTWGGDRNSLVVSGAMAGLQALRPSFAGGCRPMRIHRYLLNKFWRTDVHERVTSWGITTEIVIATRLK